MAKNDPSYLERVGVASRVVYVAKRARLGLSGSRLRAGKLKRRGAWRKQEQQGKAPSQNKEEVETVGQQL